MFQLQEYKGSKEEQFALATAQLIALVEGESSRIANLANASALLGQFLKEINWAGFYLMEGDQLVLGPFQGLPACVRIPLGRGVCGTAALQRRTVRVDDVEQFPGHIACDAASRSEIVIPMIKYGELLGVLDIDSPLKNRFDEEDERLLEQFTAELVKRL
ncbi:Free methionine-R-sulfoxide reductase [Chlamydia abortus]|uniref:GAF domain-containing protein n=1 Tax=Paenibacillus residui TaxID=629724 RepID=A0ABW3DDZ9_9BACL|nr:Free methionine-R-sulfoxide reductase [Chlamydia abortus]